MLSRYDTGQERVVVGWDHPAKGAFWQEFNREPDDPYEIDANWEEMIRFGGYMPGLNFGGYMPGLKLKDFCKAVPKDLRKLITPEVMALLHDHSRQKNSGYTVCDLSKVKK